MEDLLSPLGLLFKVLHNCIRILEVGHLPTRPLMLVDIVVGNRYPLLNLFDLGLVGAV